MQTTEIKDIKTAVCEQMGYTDIKDPEFAQECSDIAQHGGNNGTSGFIYYTETGEFYDANSSAIWEMLEADADSFGQTVPEMIAGFNCAGDITDDAQFKNALAWYALESVARDISENATDDDDAS